MGNAMMKRERLPSPEPQLAVSTTKSPPPTCLLDLTDEILWCILEWSRPADDDPRIWLWVCRISATCKVFRRVIRMDKEKVPRLLPTLFELSHYNNDYIAIAQLMISIRSSTWMGSNIRRVVACNHPSMIQVESVIGRELKQLLLTSQCLPKLKEICVDCGDAVTIDDPFFLVGNDFFPGIASLYPKLTKLSLYGCFDYHTSPESFTNLVSLKHLQHFGLQLCYRPLSASIFWFKDAHLNTIVSSLNPSLTSLVFDARDASHAFTTNGFSGIAEHFHKLENLVLKSNTIATSQVVNIIRANKSLTRINLSHVDGDETIIDAIVAQQLLLTTFRANYCMWVNSDSIMKLLHGQIEAFGQVYLTKIGICTTRVAPTGLRAFLQEWRLTNPVLPMEVEVFQAGEIDKGIWRSFVDEFPKVDLVSFRAGVE